jgi:hypothetical protein
VTWEIQAMKSIWHWIKLWLCSGVCLVGVTAAAQEAEAEEQSGFRWWWSDDDSDQDESEEDRPWMLSSPFANVSWPEIRMPKIEFRPPWGSEDDQENGGWIVTPFTRARQATRGAIDRTRTAWNSAIDRMKFVLPGGDEANSPQVAASDSGPNFWQRLFGDDDAKEEPNSVGDLMAKEPSPNRSRYRR